MKKFTLVAALVAAGALTTANAADTGAVAYWSFNNPTLPGGGFGWLDGQLPVSAGFGAQAGSATVGVTGGITGETIVTGGGDTVYRWIQDFAGSTVNAQFGEPSGGSLAVQGGTSNANNGAQIVVSFDAGLWMDLNFSFAGQRTGTGFNNVTIDAFDGGDFLGNIASGVFLPASFGLFSFDASILNGVSDARIVMTLEGVTSATGNNRYDNFFISGKLIPTPGAAALMGLAGLVGVRRRR